MTMTNANANAAADQKWNALRWYEQEECAHLNRRMVDIIDGEDGCPRPIWATEEVISAYMAEIAPEALPREPSDSELWEVYG